MPSPPLCPPVQDAAAARSAALQSPARGQAEDGGERGVGLLLMQTEFIYQLSIAALISLKTKTLLPTNLQANKFCISCEGEKTGPIKTFKLSNIVIVYRICFQDSPMLEDGVHFGSAPSGC